jgi:hypothetical protein
MRYLGQLCQVIQAKPNRVKFDGTRVFSDNRASAVYFKQ